MEQGDMTEPLCGVLYILYTVADSITVSMRQGGLVWWGI